MTSDFEPDSNRDRQRFRAWRKIPTRWLDNDVYGHVNNTIYYGWFDTAVNAWLAEAGLLDVVAGSVIGLVVETGCRYHKSVSFPETVDAGIRIARMGNSSVRWEVGLFRGGDPEPAAEGHFVHIYVDRQTRRPVRVPDAWREKMAALVLDSGGGSL